MEESKEKQAIDKVGDDKQKAVSYFTNLPIGQLISTPFVEMAKGQAALCEVYVQTLFKIAYEAEKGNKQSDNTRILKFAYTRPIVDKVTGKVTQQSFEINAPLLALVPLPAFTMDSTDVKFDMEVNIANAESNTTSGEASTSVDFSFWGTSGNIAGKITNTSNHSYSNTQKATYSISARAVQQAPSEGMSKLTSLLAETMEPIEMTKS